MKKKHKWKVLVFGQQGEDFEISVVREDYKHGQESWGWFEDRKLLISQCDCEDDEIGVRPFVWNKLIKLANEFAEKLNDPQ